MLERFVRPAVLLAVWAVFSSGPPAAQAGPCFGSTAWNTIGGNGLCVTTDRTAWQAVSATSTRIDLAAPEGGGVPLLADGLSPTSDAPLATISEIMLEAIGRADYGSVHDAGTGEAGALLTAGALTEIFIGTPEIPAGGIWTPRLPTQVILDSGLTVGLEPGVTLNIDFDLAEARPRLWAASFGALMPGLVGLHTVLSDPAQPGELAQSVEPRIPVDADFLGVAAPEGLEIARVQLYLRTGDRSTFVLDEMFYSFEPVPEPTAALLLQIGLVVLSLRRPGGLRRARASRGQASVQ